MTVRSLLCVAAICASLVSAACGKDPEVAKRDFLKSGDAYFAQKKYREAIVEYRNAIRIDPRFADARRNLAESYARVGETQNAFTEFLRAADLLPDDIETQLKAGGLMLAAEQFEDARTRADQILAKAPGNVEAQIVRASALAGLKQTDEAVTQLESLVRESPGDTRAHSALGAMRMMQGERAEAESAFLKAIATDPKSVRARLALANYYWATGRTADAEIQLKSALSTEPRNLLINRWVAGFYFESGKRAEAEPYFKMAAEMAVDPAGKLLLADYYRAMRRWDDAEAALTDVEKRNPALESDVTVGRAQIEVAKRNPSAAVTLLDPVLRYQPNRVDALIVKATALVEMQELERALSVAQAATVAAPDFATAQYTLGRVQQLRLRRKEAITAFQAALRLDPRYAAAGRALAEMHLDVGKLAEAEEAASNAFRNSQTGDALLLLARVHVRQNRLANAERELAALLRRQPESLAVLTEIGRMRLGLNDLRGARSVLESVLAKDPMYVDALDALTMVDARDHRVPAAKARLEAAAQKDAGDGRLLTMLAKLQMATNDLMGAEATLQKAIALKPSLPEAHGLLGQIYQSQGKSDRAIKEFELLAALEPGLAGPHTMMGTMYQQQNRRPEAKEAYRRALAIDATAAIPANNLALLYAEDNERLDEAQSLAQTARRGMPDSADAIDTLGWIYHLSGQKLLAIKVLEEAATHNPQNPTVNYHLGLAYAKNDDFRQARTTLERALKLDPASPLAGEARTQLARLDRLGA